MTANQRSIIDCIRKNRAVAAREMADSVGISQRKIEENLAKLKAVGILRRIGPAKGGYWEIVKD